MWIMLSDAFLSIVEYQDDPKRLLVRARVPGHIKRVFPKAEVVTDEFADYRYRAFIERAEVSKAVAKEVDRIDYTSFKDSVQDEALHDTYLNVWSRLYALQREP